MKNALVFNSFIFVLSAGCKSHNSQVKVTNGVTAAEGQFPSVVRIADEGNCTATFVTPSILLTAAHCVKGSEPDVSGRSQDSTLIGIFKGIEMNTQADQTIEHAAQIITHPGYVKNRGWESDLAIITFESNLSTDLAKIREVPPDVGDEFVIVGYGDNKREGFDGTGNGIKRFGKNKISKMTDEFPWVASAFITFEGVTEDINSGAPTGESVLIAHGDSGGPLFIDEQIAGINSNMEGGGSQRVHDVNLNSFWSKMFFLYLKRLNIDLGLSEAYFAGIENELFGLYKATTNDCLVFVDRIGDMTKLSTYVGLKPISGNCMAPIKFNGCTASGCPSTDGAQLSITSGTKFTYQAANGNPIAFEHVVEQTAHKNPTSSSSGGDSYTNWDEGEPGTSGDCIRVVASGKWRDSKCSDRYAYACKDGDDWVISKKVGAGDEYHDQFCGSLGKFSTPTDKTQTDKLVKAMTKAGKQVVWVSRQR
jgi:hypothetical protein